MTRSAQRLRANATKFGHSAPSSQATFNDSFLIRSLRLLPPRRCSPSIATRPRRSPHQPRASVQVFGCHENCCRYRQAQASLARSRFASTDVFRVRYSLLRGRLWTSKCRKSRFARLRSIFGNKTVVPMDAQTSIGRKRGSNSVSKVRRRMGKQRMRARRKRQDLAKNLRRRRAVRLQNKDL